MQKIADFKLADGRQISIILPTMEFVQEITDFVNRLTDEDTFLTFTGQHITLESEKNWLENALTEIKFKKNYIVWAVINDRIIGSADIHRGGSTRDAHVGTIGLMVDRDFRGQGLGKFLLSLVLEQAKMLSYQIVTVELFSDNIIAIKLYRKMGFKVWGRLPRGLYRKGKYSDKIEMYKEL